MILSCPECGWRVGGSRTQNKKLYAKRHGHSLRCAPPQEETGCCSARGNQSNVRRKQLTMSTKNHNWSTTPWRWPVENHKDARCGSQLVNEIMEVATTNQLTNFEQLPLVNAAWELEATRPVMVTRYTSPISHSVMNSKLSSGVNRAATVRIAASGASSERQPRKNRNLNQDALC